MGKIDKVVKCFHCGSNIGITFHEVILEADLRRLMEEKVTGINTDTEFGKGYAAASYDWYNSVNYLLNRGE